MAASYDADAFVLRVTFAEPLRGDSSPLKNVAAAPRGGRTAPETHTIKRPADFLDRLIE